MKGIRHYVEPCIEWVLLETSGSGMPIDTNASKKERHDSGFSVYQERFFLNRYDDTLQGRGLQNPSS